MVTTEIQINHPSPDALINILPIDHGLAVSRIEQKDEQTQKIQANDKKTVEKRDEKHIAENIAEVMNSVAGLLNTHISFDVHESTGKIVVQVIDSESGEIRRQIPPREMLQLIDKMRTLVGVLFNQEA